MGSIDLIEVWLAEAVALRGIGEDLAAEYAELHALQLRVRLRQEAEEGQGRGLLTVTEAAARSGLSTGYLRSLLSSGAVKNVGRPSHPRIRAEDLPQRKRRRYWPRRRHPWHDPDAGILSIFGPEATAAQGD